MTEAWRDKDGLEKNVEKFTSEWKKLKDAMKPEFVRFLKRPWDVHSYVNLLVESRRCSPYLIGHIDAVLYPILIVAIFYMIGQDSCPSALEKFL